MVGLIGLPLQRKLPQFSCVTGCGTPLQVPTGVCSHCFSSEEYRYGIAAKAFCNCGKIFSLKVAEGLVDTSPVHPNLRLYRPLPIPSVLLVDNCRVCDPDTEFDAVSADFLKFSWD